MPSAKLDEGPWIASKYLSEVPSASMRDSCCSRYFDHKFLDEHSRVYADGTRYDLKYANDLETSLFGDKTLTSIVADFTKWEDMHSELDDLLECEISGVNTNYFYIARQGSMAPVHVEDFR